MKRKEEGRKRKVRVVLTQSRGRLEVVQEILEQRGYEVIRQPLIETQPLLDEQTKLEAQKLLDCAWLLFTSRTAAETWQHLFPPPSSHRSCRQKNRRSPATTRCGSSHHRRPAKRRKLCRDVFKSPESRFTRWLAARR
jgi:hypothetical protein